jgi:hypothetical protein
MFWLWLVLLVFLIFGLTVFRGAPYLPSQKKNIRIALTELYPLTKNDTLIDIGSGDGVVLRQASKLGAAAVGYEINPILVLVSRLLSIRYKHIKVHLSDFWYSHLPSDTTVIYVFSVGRDMRRIYKWAQSETNNVKHPISLISYGFKLPEMKVSKKAGPFYLYVIHPLH